MDLVAGTPPVAVVDRIISDRAIFEVTLNGFVLRAIALGESVEELRALTGAHVEEDLT